MANLTELLTKAGRDRLGHWFGGILAMVLWNRPWIKRAAAANPIVAKLIAESFAGATSIFELQGNSNITRLLNSVVDALGTESLDVLEKMSEADPTGTESKIEAAVAAKFGEVYVFAGHAHKNDKCRVITEMTREATERDRTGKDGKAIKGTSLLRPPEKMTFEEAMDGGHPLCGVCYPSAAHAPEKKSSGAAPALADHFQKFQQDHPAKFDELFGDRTKAYWVTVEGDVAVKQKFQLVFHRQDRYALLEKLLLTVPPDMWSLWLDMAMDVDPNESLRERAKREAAETEQMLLAFLDALKDVPATIDGLTAKVKAWGQEAKDARDARKTNRKNRKALANVAFVIVITGLGLLALLAPNGTSF